MNTADGPGWCGWIIGIAVAQYDFSFAQAFSYVSLEELKKYWIVYHTTPETRFFTEIYEPKIDQEGK